MTKYDICHCGNKKQASSKQCRDCYLSSGHLQSIAPLGFKATAKKHGFDFGIKFLQQWRLDHPSSYEVEVMTQLDAQGLSYEREHLFTSPRGRHYLIDFIVDHNGLVIPVEVDSVWVHSHHLERDRRKHQAITANWGRLVILKDQDIKSDVIPIILESVYYTGVAR